MTWEARTRDAFRARHPAPPGPPLAPAYVLFLTCRYGHATSTTYALELGLSFVEREAVRAVGAPLCLGMKMKRKGGQARCSICGSTELMPQIDSRLP
jgi:hypothetical protein